MSKELWKEEDFRKEMSGLDKVVDSTEAALKAEGEEFELINDGSQITIKAGGRESTFLKKNPVQIKVGNEILEYKLSDYIRSKVLHPELSSIEALHKIGAKTV